MSLIMNNDIEAMKRELNNLFLDICSNNTKYQKYDMEVGLWEDIDIQALYNFIIDNIRVKPESQVFKVGDKFINKETKEEFIIAEIGRNLYKLINTKTFNSFSHSFSYITKEEFKRQMISFQCVLT